MASSAPLRLLTPRDVEILAALDYCPLTALQLLKFSQTFDRPFRSEGRVRKRLLQLCVAGRVHRWRYATAGQGAPNYYTLSLLGFRLLHGDDAVPPTRRAFLPVGLSKQHHTQSLADFIVHTAVAAHRRGIVFTGFHRENTLRLQVGDDSLFPDAAFRLIDPRGGEYSYFLEIDAGSERIRSPKDLESWEAKIRFYDRLQEQSGTRFRVLVVTIGRGERLGRILDAARSILRNPNRPLLYGISLPEYLPHGDPLKAACFTDQRGSRTALVTDRLFPKPALSPLPLRATPHGQLPPLST